MPADRRNFAALLLAAPVLASCAPTASDNAKVSDIIDAVSKWMPWTNAVALGISVLVPVTAPFVPLVEQAIEAVFNSLNQVKATMDATTAKPILTRIELDMGGGLQILDNMVQQIPEDKGRAKYAVMLAQAEAILAQVEAIVNNSVATLPTSRARVAPRNLWLRKAR